MSLRLPPFLRIILVCEITFTALDLNDACGVLHCRLPALLRDLVEDLGGHLILSDRPGGGTSVVADLPNSNGHGK
jgi:hypothetical protein